MQYLLLIHNYSKSDSTEQQCQEFFTLVRQSGLFAGGSAVGKKTLVGATTAAATSDHIEGYMRFDSEELQPLLDLLQRHPVILNGGTVENSASYQKHREDRCSK